MRKNISLTKEQLKILDKFKNIYQTKSKTNNISIIDTDDNNTKIFSYEDNVINALIYHHTNLDLIDIKYDKFIDLILHSDKDLTSNYLYKSMNNAEKDYFKHLEVIKKTIYKNYATWKELKDGSGEWVYTKNKSVQRKKKYKEKIFTGNIDDNYLNILNTLLCYINSNSNNIYDKLPRGSIKFVSEKMCLSHDTIQRKLKSLKKIYKNSNEFKRYISIANKRVIDN